MFNLGFRLFNLRNIKLGILTTPFIGLAAYVIWKTPTLGEPLAHMVKPTVATRFHHTSLGKNVAINAKTSIVFQRPATKNQTAV